MLHHERVKPPIEDYPPDEWSLVERSFRPEFAPQMETVLALANGYLGMRGVHEEGGPAVQNGTFVNGFYETWPNCIRRGGLRFCADRPDDVECDRQQDHQAICG